MLAALGFFPLDELLVEPHRMLHLVSVVLPVAEQLTARHHLWHARQPWVPGHDRIEISPNGANDRVFRPDVPKRAGLPECYVLFFGQFAPWQGIETLVAAQESARAWWCCRASRRQPPPRQRRVVRPRRCLRVVRRSSRRRSLRRRLPWHGKRPYRVAAYWNLIASFGARLRRAPKHVRVMRNAAEYQSSTRTGLPSRKARMSSTTPAK